jgi:phage terminase large subunit GpA-like protein
MTPQVATLRRVFREAIRPPPRLTVSEWAARERVLVPPATPSAWCGPWRTNVAPFLREPMDRLSPYDPTQRVVLMLPSQIGKSEVANNCVGYYIAAEPSSILVVQPTENAAKAYSRERLDPMISACQALRERVAPEVSRDRANTLSAKEFRGGHIAIVGANAPTGLASRSRRIVLVDEVDRCPAEVGAEGDVLAVVEQRTQNHMDRKILLVSTPTTVGESVIHRAYLQGDQRRWLVPCPDCGAEQEFVWERTVDGRSEFSLRWDDGDPDSAAYTCEACGVLIGERHKAAMNAKGYWQSQADGDGVTVSYHLEALASPFVSWGDLVRRWLAAEGDPAKIQPFTNLVRGLPWDQIGSSGIDAHALVSRRETFAEPLPAGVQVLTAAIDVQDTRLELGVWGFGHGEESWAVEHLVIWGDPSGRRVWDDARRYLLERRWGALRIASCCVDTGGHHTTDGYRFVKGLERAHGIGVYATIGRSGPDRPMWPKRVDPSPPGDPKPTIYSLGIDEAKGRIYQRLTAAAREGPGAIHLPVAAWCDEAWCDQLTAEVRRTVLHAGRSRIRWVCPDHRRNEALDIAVYALAALHAWLSRGHRLRPAESVKSAKEVDFGAPAAQPSRPRPAPRPTATRDRLHIGGERAGGWLR